MVLALRDLRFAIVQIDDIVVANPEQREHHDHPHLGHMNTNTKAVSSFCAPISSQ